MARREGKKGRASGLRRWIPRRFGRGARIAAAIGAGLGAAALAIAWGGAGCSGWDPSAPFERNAPEVDEAIRDLDAGKLESAEEALERYLGTGPCTDGGIGLPDTVREKHNGSFDLGLVLFHVAERFGRRFGDEEEGRGEGTASADDEVRMARRSAEIDCALVVVKAIASDDKVPIDLRARAHYLAGNLEFLRRRYEEAVRQYDEALKLVPGVPEEAGGDGIGRDAAWNRAIALRRIEDQKDAGPDAPDEPPDASDDAADVDEPDAESPPDAGPDGGEAGPDGGDEDENESEPDAGEGDAGDDGGNQGEGPDAGGEDGGQDGGSEPPSEPEPQPSEPPPSDARQDERILDQLEEAPTYQEQEAKQRARSRGRAMEDK